MKGSIKLVSKLRLLVFTAQEGQCERMFLQPSWRHLILKDDWSGLDCDELTIQRLGFAGWRCAQLAFQHIGAQTVLPAYAILITQGAVDSHQAAVGTFEQRVQYHQPLCIGQCILVAALCE